MIHSLFDNGQLRCYVKYIVSVMVVHFFIPVSCFINPYIKLFEPATRQTGEKKSE